MEPNHYHRLVVMNYFMEQKMTAHPPFQTTAKLLIGHYWTSREFQRVNWNRSSRHREFPDAPLFQFSPVIHHKVRSLPENDARPDSSFSALARTLFDDSPPRSLSLTLAEDWVESISVCLLEKMKRWVRAMTARSAAAAYRGGSSSWQADGWIR